jgi:hypothetical protein
LVNRPQGDSRNRNRLHRRASPQRDCLLQEGGRFRTDYGNPGNRARPYPRPR